MKILLLSSSTGGGHDMRARSLAQWAAASEARPLGIETSRHQALENGAPLYVFGAGLYNLIQRRLPALHHVYFNVLELFPFCGSARTMPGRAAFQQLVRRANPDLVLSTHDHLNHAFLDAARDAMPGNPPLCGTYCGELSGGYGFSKHWVNPRADFFIGAVDACTEAARRHGMSPEKSWTGGFLLNPDFWASPDATSPGRVAFFCETLRLEPSRFTLLLGTGSNGANNHLALLNELARARVHPQVIALCGRNEQARRDIDAWARSNAQIPVRALGYQQHMRQVMDCADLLFARPGTGTTSEALQTGIPIVFNGIGGVMPQELITLRYCRRFFETLVVRRARALPALISQLMSTPDRLATMRSGIVHARPDGHPVRILERLAALRRVQART
ncbi:MAG: hypothetical protein LBD14_02850 [Puniceicoccales bacterium]|jgi:processive 1,2-diacylglycerol beta-glucosyltransferase|nr:hypothetical protein [Puniceicoccales bacterium]